MSNQPPPPDQSDLVARLGADDPAALEDAYRLFAPRCRAIAYRVLRNDALAQDAVQETFLALWRHRHGLVLRSSGILPWLAVVVRNAALSTVRADNRRSAREERAIDASPALDPAEIVGASADAAAVRQALQLLPPEQRDVIVLAYFRSLTLTQIAERTGAPLGTVKSRAHAALQRLGRALEGQVS